VSNQARASSHHHARFAAGCLAGLLAVLAGCSDGDDWREPPPSPDGTLFVSDVYPLLLGNCAFSTCHGNRNRFLQLYGPGRARLDPGATRPDDPMTLPEVVHSYDRARAMLATASRPSASLLLRKPLDIVAGGQGHEGADEFGRNVFGSTQAPGYLLLMRWARSEGTQPTADEVEAAIAAAGPDGEQ